MRGLTGARSVVLLAGFAALAAGTGAFVVASAPAGSPGRSGRDEGGSVDGGVGAAGGTRRHSLRATFTPLATVPASSLSMLAPFRPTFEGQVAPRPPGSAGRATPAPTTAGGGAAPPSPGAAVTQTVTPAVTPPGVTVGPDIFVADGSETALAVNSADGTNLAAVLNQGYSNSASLLDSINGGLNWTTRSFPTGSGTFTGFAFDPWASAGTVAGELYTSFMRRNTVSPAIHAILARSTDGGVSWSRIFEAARIEAQDRDMFDVDRTGVQGGGPGSTYDGTIYLTYDGFDTTSNSNYVASYLEVLSQTGALIREVTTSSPSPTGFNGTEMQPVAGTTDGQVYLMSVATSLNGTVMYLIFHEADGAGATFAADRSLISFPPVGQQLGTSGRYGLNGHRIGTQAQMDIDRSNGPRRGTLYVVEGSNPNPGDPTQDQGDIHLLISADGAHTWNNTVIPDLAPGKTQFFGMLDVDDDGWIHVAYYQNETGGTNNGVLNASQASLYYTVSNDGGLTWAPHTLVNAPADALNYDDPPLDLSMQSYYLIGDYPQVRAAIVSGSRSAYVFWTGYDKNRTDRYLGDKRERGICTRVTPSVDTDGDGWLDPQDNCPAIYNPGQEDLNNNGIGDICENWPCRANADDTGSSKGRIDGSDLFPLARAFGSCGGGPAYNPAVDLSPQGCVDGYDLALLASVWGDSVICP